jgi:hypothetical protein
VARASTRFAYAGRGTQNEGSPLRKRKHATLTNSPSRNYEQRIDMNHGVLDSLQFVLRLSSSLHRFSNSTHRVLEENYNRIYRQDGGLQIGSEYLKAAPSAN